MCCLRLNNYIRKKRTDKQYTYTLCHTFTEAGKKPHEQYIHITYNINIYTHNGAGYPDLKDPLRQMYFVVKQCTHQSFAE